MMRRRVGTTAVAVLVALGAVASVQTAWAESVTVQGTSQAEGGEPTDVKKTVVNNGTGSVLLKIHGTGGKSAVRWVTADIRDGDGTKYEAMGGWYGADWIVSLSRGGTLIDCDAMVFRYVADPGFWKVQVPRSCLNRLADRIRAQSEIVSPTSAYPGYTPWSPWVKRG
jgi:hypothetical protein